MPCYLVLGQTNSYLSTVTVQRNLSKVVAVDTVFIFRFFLLFFSSFHVFIQLLQTLRYTYVTTKENRVQLHGHYYQNLGYETVHKALDEFLNGSNLRPQLFHSHAEHGRIVMPLQNNKK